MGRIRLVVVLAMSFLLVSLAAEAQQANVYRVGLLLQGSPPPPGSPPGAFRRALHDLGYIEGRNIVFDSRWAEGKNERFPGLAAELVAQKPDVIVANTTPGTMATMRATTTIPIVMAAPADPVGAGLVASLAHPGGNVTGVTDFSTDLNIKGVDLLRAIVPKATRLGILMSADNPVHALQLKAIEDAAKPVGLSVQPSSVRSLEEFEGAFASMAKERAEVLIVLGGAPFSTPAQWDKLVALAAKTKLPTLALPPARTRPCGSPRAATGSGGSPRLCASYPLALTEPEHGSFRGHARGGDKDAKLRAPVLRRLLFGCPPN